MNYLPCVVTRVLDRPIERRFDDIGVSVWEIRVEFDCYGVKSEMVLDFASKKEADDVAPGYTWEAPF